MGTANGIHHLAICTGDMKAQIEFFTDVLGCELKALYWMHGVDNTFHGFLRFNDRCSIAFVQNPDIASIKPVVGLSRAATTGSPSAPGTTQHIAFNVDTEEELHALRDRIRSRRINVLGPIDHGMCKSMYFAGPEGLNLEIATSAVPIDERAWIDPEVVALCGIGNEELASFVAPMAYVNAGPALPNPPVDWSKPQMGYPRDVYERLMNLPDDAIAARMSYSDPPVKVPV